MDKNIRKEEIDLLEEYKAQVAQDDKHDYSVYAVDHSDHSDSCCC